MKNIAIIICLFSMTSNAGKESFAHRLRNDAIMFSVFGIPLDILGISLPIGIYYHYNTYKLLNHADLLESAHKESHNNETNMGKYHAKLDKYYKHLIKKYPATILSRAEVVQALDDLYHNGAKIKFHKQLYRGKDEDSYLGLSNTLFRNGDLSWYRSYKKAWEEAHYQKSPEAKEIAEKIRNVKNSFYDNK